MFILLYSIIRKIESTLTVFIWKGTLLESIGAKVAWYAICYPLKKGGLGIKRLKIWNKVATMKHV
jgi:hypothetical protein